MRKIGSKVYNYIGFGSLLLVCVFYFIFSINVKETTYDSLTSAPFRLYLLIGLMVLFTLVGLCSFMVKHQIKTHSKKLFYVQLIGLIFTIIGITIYSLAIVNMYITFLKPPADASQEVMSQYILKLLDHRTNTNNQQLLGQFMAVVGVHVFGLGSLVVLAEFRQNQETQ